MHQCTEQIAADELMDVAATALMLKVSRQTLATWRSTKRQALPYVKIGSLVRYRRRDVERFIQACTIAGGPQC